MDAGIFDDEVTLARVEIFGINAVSMVYLNDNPVTFAYNIDTKVSVLLSIDL